MKNKFSLRIILGFFLLVNFASTSFSQIQVQEKSSFTEIVTIRTIELYSTVLMKSMMYIAYPDGTVEEIPLKRFTKGDLSENLQLINEKLNEFYLKGYQLENSFGGSSDGAVISTYILSREMLINSR